MLRVAAICAMRTLVLGMMALLAAPAWAETPPLGRPLRIVFESTPNPPRYLGEGTAIDWTHPGLTLELLRLVGARLGLTLEFERMPWKRGLYLLETGEADGLFHASFAPDRMKLGVYPMKDGAVDPVRAIFDQAYVFYRLRGSAFGWDGKSITGAAMLIGATAGYSVVKDMKALGLAVDESKSKEIALTKLLGGRIAAYADLETMTDAFLFKNADRYATIEKVEPAFRVKSYYLMLSHGFYRSHPDLAERIWDTIADVNRSPEFQALIPTYAD